MLVCKRVKILTGSSQHAFKIFVNCLVGFKLKEIQLVAMTDSVMTKLIV